MLSLTTNGVLSSEKPVKHVVFNIRNMLHINTLNKSGPSIKALRYQEFEKPSKDNQKLYYCQ